MNDLPIEIIRYILYKIISLKNITNLKLVCKQWKDIINDNTTIFMILKKCSEDTNDNLSFEHYVYPAISEFLYLKNRCTNIHIANSSSDCTSYIFSIHLINKPYPIDLNITEYKLFKKKIKQFLLLFLEAN